MTEIFPANQDTYQRAAAQLRAGSLCVLPTETVYGLAARADDEAAIARVYAVKERPETKPFSLCISGPSAAEDIAEISPLASTLMDAFWPGPLTLVLPLRRDAPLAAGLNAGFATIGLRMPDAPWAWAFSNMGFTAPLVLSSANIAGMAPPRSAQDVKLGGDIAMIVDGGPSAIGTPSTIIALNASGNTAKLLRRGALGPESFAPFSIDWNY